MYAKTVTRKKYGKKKKESQQKEKEVVNLLLKIKLYTQG